MSIKDCKEIENDAKILEKESLTEAVEKYKQAADCYKKNDKAKKENSCLEKAAKLLREDAKVNENPDEAFKIYSKSSKIYKQALNESEANKVILEAQAKFVMSAKSIRAGAKKISDPKEAETLLTNAFEYAIKGKDDELSKMCWVDLGTKFRLNAVEKENPREALSVFQYAVENYRKGGNGELETKTWIDAGNKFIKSGEEIEKSKKDLVFAIDNFMQAATIFREAKREETSTDLNGRVNKLCEMIGLPLDYIEKYLESKDLTKITVK